jgi:hypothetical protein
MKSKKWKQIAVTAAAISVAPLLSTGAQASPEIRQQGEVTFVSGGVGVTEMEEIKRLSPSFPVELLFVSNSVPDRYLAGTLVQIKDGDGKVVLDTQSQGPVLLAKMPRGRYLITADTNGVVKRDTVQVGAGKAQRIVFVWNLPVDVDP